jgi:hypothetical protein
MELLGVFEGAEVFVLRGSKYTPQVAKHTLDVTEVKEINKVNDSAVNSSIASEGAGSRTARLQKIRG